jgi:hypothetical protein
LNIFNSKSKKKLISTIINLILLAHVNQLII